MENSNLLELITVGLSIFLGYATKTYITRHKTCIEYEKETQVNERDLLERVDKLSEEVIKLHERIGELTALNQTMEKTIKQQTQEIIRLTAENVQLTKEVKSLRSELSKEKEFTVYEC